jgi:hypothetical protein
MTVFTKYEPGTFCHVDLGTSDHAGAKKFYGALFGWEMEDMPAGPDMVYTMCRLNGHDVAAIAQMSPDMQAQGIPPMWNSFVSVANVDETARCAKELGGAVLTEPMDVFDVGRMAVVQDPTGGVIVAWQAGTFVGATLVNVPGCFCWNELVTHDPQKATDFYTGLLGWNTHVMNMGKFDYTTFLVGERANGGMMQIQPDWGDMPPSWSVYFAVEDCDAAVEKAQSLGGKLFVPPTDIPDTGRFAMVQDPQGAAFYLIKMFSAPPDPQ